MQGRQIMVLAVVLAATPGAARADDAAEARALAERGVALARDGRALREAGDAAHRARFDEAIALFKQAFALDPRPEYQCSIGIAYRDKEQPAPAHLFIGRCLARTVDAERKAALRRVHDALEQSLRVAGHVPVDVITRPRGASVGVSHFAADETVPAPVQVWLPAGTHTIVARAEGYQPAEKEIAVEGSAGQTVQLTLARVPVAPVTRPVTHAPVAGALGPPVAVDTAPPPRRRGRVLPWIAVAGGGASLLAGAAVHVMFVRGADEIEDLTGEAYDDKRGTLQRQRAATIGLYAAGAAAAGVGLYLLVGDDAAGDSSAVGLAPTTDGATVWWTWQR